MAIANAEPGLDTSPPANHASPRQRFRYFGYAMTQGPNGPVMAPARLTADKRATDNANRTINGRDTFKMIARSFAHNRDAAAHAAIRTICSVRGSTCGGVAQNTLDFNGLQKRVVHFAPIQPDVESGRVVWVKPVVLFSV